MFLSTNWKKKKYLPSLLGNKWPKQHVALHQGYSYDKVLFPSISKIHFIQTLHGTATNKSPIWNTGSAIGMRKSLKTETHVDIRHGQKRKKWWCVCACLPSSLCLSAVVMHSSSSPGTHGKVFTEPSAPNCHANSICCSVAKQWMFFKMSESVVLLTCES